MRPETATADPVQQLFAQHNLRCTRQRRALYEALSATHRHPAADELFQQVARNEQGISLATVYNTLEAFCRAGLALKLPGGGGADGACGGGARYDATTHNHLHLRDERTGRVADVPDELGEKLLASIPSETIAKLEQQLGFKVSQLQIELVGQFRANAPALQ
jgi:Fur family peroxide stress response transcriptional regulator